MSPYVLFGVLFLGGFFFLYLAALSWADLSFVMPLTALSYVFAAVLAKVFLKEQVSLLRWAGILVIVAGIALLASGERHQRTVQRSTNTAGYPPQTGQAGSMRLDDGSGEKGPYCREASSADTIQ